jgi:lysophospholipase L1-like esterase
LTLPAVYSETAVNCRALFAALLCLSGLAAGPARAADAFELRDGDRVVLLGNTLIEREQQTGYWESALTRRYPGRNVQFRNLGWSGDTVFGEARAGFGTAADGFKHLKEHVLALKPTVILVAYGSNEAFEGKAGLPRFVQGLNTLLDTLAPAKARVILLSPLRQEDLGRPLPDPAEQNRRLALYRDTLCAAARQRGLAFVDLYELVGAAAQAAPLTDNGIHLTPYGYWRTAAALEKGLGLLESRWRVAVSAKGGKPTAEGAQVSDMQVSPLRFRVTDEVLPVPPPPTAGAPKKPAAQGERVLRVSDLPPGSYTLTVDGKPVAAADAAGWAKGVRLGRGPEFDQSGRLRQAVVAKDRLYFYRWRPQNETYLFGFRKHEQGQNAREVPQFDPLVARKEAEIAKLRVPVAHTYELKQEKP